MIGRKSSTHRGDVKRVHCYRYILIAGLGSVRSHLGDRRCKSNVKFSGMWPGLHGITFSHMCDAFPGCIQGIQGISCSGE